MKSSFFKISSIFALVVIVLLSCTKEKVTPSEIPKEDPPFTATSNRTNSILAPDSVFLLNGILPTPGSQIEETDSLAILIESGSSIKVFQTENLLFEWAVVNGKSELVERIKQIRNYRKIGEDLGFPDELPSNVEGQLNIGIQERSPSMFLFANINQGGATWPSGPTWSYGNKRNTASSYAGFGGTTIFDKRWWNGSAVYLVGLAYGNLNGPEIFFNDRAESGF